MTFTLFTCFVDVSYRREHHQDAILNLCNRPFMARKIRILLTFLQEREERVL